MREETSPASWASYDELEIQMDTLQIAKEQVISLDHIADGIRGLRLAFVNVFAVTHLDSSWTLVDAALPFTARLIRHWAEKHFNWPPNAIVLTHGHFDHVSAAGELAREWDVPIYAHPMEFPYLTGISEYPAPDVDVGGGLMSLVSPLYPRGPVNLSDWLRELPADGGGISALAQLPEWQVLHTPGHSPGHVSFYRPEDRALIVGDAFCTTKPESLFEVALAQQPELHGPPSYFTSNWEHAGRSVQRLAELEPRIVFPGHGRPLAGEFVAQALHRLAEEFGPLAAAAKKVA